MERYISSSISTTSEHSFLKRLRKTFSLLIQSAKIKSFWIIALLSIILNSTLLSQDSLNIGFSIGDFHVERWQKDKTYFVHSANQLGARVFCEYAYGDKKKQVAQVKKLIELGIKVIVIIPTDSHAFKEVVELGKSKGVKFISYDRLMMNTDVDYYISFDNKKVGELQAKFALEQKPKGNYVLLAGPTKDNNAVLFLEGQLKALKPSVDNGNINILLNKHLSEWSSMDSFLEMQKFFEDSDKKIDAVIASNDLIANGVIMAYNMYKDNMDIVLTGQDATVEAVKNIFLENQSMTIYKPVMNLAKEAALISVSMIKGKKIETQLKVNNKLKDVPSILLKPIVVTKDNIEETVISDGYYTESEVYDNW